MPQRTGAERTNSPKPPSYVGAGEGPFDLGVKAEHYLRTRASEPRDAEGRDGNPVTSTTFLYVIVRIFVYELIRS
jgi:hypothetical protein